MHILHADLTGGLRSPKPSCYEHKGCPIGYARIVSEYAATLRYQTIKAYLCELCSFCIPETRTEYKKSAILVSNMCMQLMCFFPITVS